MMIAATVTMMIMTMTLMLAINSVEGLLSATANRRRIANADFLVSMLG